MAGLGWVGVFGSPWVLGVVVQACLRVVLADWPVHEGIVLASLPQAWVVLIPLVLVVDRADHQVDLQVGRADLQAVRVDWPVHQGIVLASLLQVLVVSIPLVLVVGHQVVQVDLQAVQVDWLVLL